MKLNHAHQRAANAAYQDYQNGEVCDPGKWGARPNSAWADWYRIAWYAIELTVKDEPSDHE